MYPFDLKPEAGVPDFVIENPGIVLHAFGEDSRMTIDEAVSKAVAYTEQVMPGFEDISDPVKAIAAKAGKCTTRAVMIHGLLSALPHLQSGIVFTADYRSHRSNVAAEKQGSRAVAINNEMEDVINPEDPKGPSIKVGKIPKPIVFSISNLNGATLTTTEGALCTRTHDRRDQVGGSFSIWRLKTFGSRYARIFDKQPSMAGRRLEDVRPYHVLLGKSATHFCNGITRHRPMDTGTRSSEVLEVMAAIEEVKAKWGRAGWSPVS